MTARVRMGTSVAEAGRLERELHDAAPGISGRVCDQLWLRTVLVEQRRRTRIAERPTFDERADRLLALLDPERR